MWYTHFNDCDGKSNRKKADRERESRLEIPVGKGAVKTTPESTARSSSVSPRKGQAKAMSEKTRWNRAHAPLRRESLGVLFFGIL